MCCCGAHLICGQNPYGLSLHICSQTSVRQVCAPHFTEHRLSMGRGWGEEVMTTGPGFMCLQAQIESAVNYCLVLFQCQLFWWMIPNCLSQKLRHPHMQSQKYFSNLLTSPKPHHRCPNHCPIHTITGSGQIRLPGSSLAPLLPTVIFLNRSPCP